MSFESDATEVNQPTWFFWNEPPLHDFARLVPASDASKEAFQSVVRDLLHRRTTTSTSYSDRFIHFEHTSPELAHPSLSEASSTSGHEDARDSRVAPGGDGIGDNDNRKPPSLPAVTGFYRLNMLDPRPANFGVGWRMGCGRSGIDVEFILGPRASGLHGIHARLKRAPSGIVLAVSDRHELWVDSARLKRDDSLPSEQQPLDVSQRALGNHSHIHLAGMVYKLEIQSIPQEAERQQLQELAVQSSPAATAASYLGTPTPRHGHDLTTVRDYMLAAPFAAGISASVHYAWHVRNGEPVAIKKVLVKDQHCQHIVANEISILKRCKHKSICQLREHFSLGFSSTNDTLTGSMSNVSEAYLVLQPALAFNLREFASSSPWLQQTSTDPTENRQKLRRSTLHLLAQVGDACAWLHAQGIMHRDIKPDNIGVSDGDQDEQSLRFYLLDFGHATFLSMSKDHYKGTIRYLAPEVVDLKHNRSQNAYTNAVDVWSLGLTSIEVLNNVTIRDLDHASGVAREVRADVLNVPSSDPWSTEQALTHIQDSMLTVQASKRASMKEVARFAEMYLWGGNLC